MDDFSTTCNSKVDRATHRRKEKKHCSPNDSDSSTVLEKTTEFFQICDIEGKGFVTRRDMQRLLKRFPLSADELENVFDSLDADGNGFLTSDEFSFGFSKFMGGPNVSPVVTCEDSVSVQSPGMLYSDDEDDEDRQFYTLMEKLGASNVFEDPEKVRSLWSQIRRKTPHLISFFEEILARVTYQIGKAHQEKKELETALKRKVATHDDEIQRLYEEMEQQIKNEKDRILLQDSERFLSRSQDLEDQLSVKEKELNILSSKHKQLERQYRELHSEQREIAVEKVKLKQYKEDLSRDLEHATRELNLAQEQLMMLQQQTSREREMEIYRVTESLQRERSSLLKQIDLLREMNKHLRDERDMCYQKPKTSGSNLSWTQKSESVTVKYSEHKLTAKSEEKDEEIVSRLKRKSVIGINGHSMDLEDVVDGRLSSKYQLRRIISIEEDHLPHLLQHGYQTQLRDWSEDEEPEEGIDLQMSNIYPTCSTPISEPAAQMSSLPREQPVGTELVQSDGVVSLFKIILVGNSSVGKTSLLRRFCEDSFVPGTCATVGIDYSVKTLTVDNRQVALQIWDTAGQERYRSITKQFFRKADGVVVVYDITSGQTFTAVREWLTSVQEGAGENVPIMLLGNKTDQDLQRQIPLGVGEKLAKDFHVIFYECSAFSAHNVTESMIHMARLLKEQEDRDKEKIVTLVDVSAKKKSCC